MANQVLVRVSMGRTTPVDYIRPTFDFCFYHAGGGAVDPAAAAAKCVGFISQHQSGQAFAVVQYFSKAITRLQNAHQVHVYDITGKLDGKTPTGPPIYSTVFGATMANSTGSPDPMPDECAVVMSLNMGPIPGVPEFAKDPLSGKETRPAARLRGRIFLGPLCMNAISPGTPDPVVNAAFQTDIIAGAQGALGVGTWLDSIVWAVWSRSNASLTDVTRVCVDNLFDIRNRRGDRRPAVKTCSS